MTKAIVLFSGGLDSLLAVQVLKEQEVEVIGLNLITPFHDCSKEAQLRANELKIKLVVQHPDNNYLQMVAHPRYGYGKAVNPCLDCRIDMCRKAAMLMAEQGADFVATGEIAGQRPNSQKVHQLNLIARESGLEGRLVRPLCAKVLEPTLPEQEGLLDRDKLGSFTGRGRGQLIGKARRKYGIRYIPQPSTGCLLCERSFMNRVLDLNRFKASPTVWDGQLLALGRLIRLDAGAKCAVARREKDCLDLIEMARRSDASPSALLVPDNFKGPAVLLVADDLAHRTIDQLPETFLTSTSGAGKREIFGEVHSENVSADENRGLGASSAFDLAGASGQLPKVPKWQQYLEMAGDLVLRFTNPSKYDPQDARVLITLGAGPARSVAVARSGSSDVADLVL